MVASTKKFWIEGTITSARHIATSKTPLISIGWIVVTVLVSACFCAHMYVMISQYLRFDKLVNIQVRETSVETYFNLSLHEQKVYCNEIQQSG